MSKRQKHVFEEENRHPRSSSTLFDNSELMPIDVFDEIFWRLSRKTIARCRCVLKLWSSILGRPDFSDLFLKMYSACRHLLFAVKLNGKWLFFSSPQPQNLDENSSLLATNHHMCFRTRPGSCGINVPICGLLCTTYMWLKDRYNDFKAMVYNLSTGQTITLSNLITSWTHARAQLGYDPTNKQVKVLCISLSKNPWKGQAYQVLTLGIGELSWRMIECSLPHHPLNIGICINVVLYYIADPNNNFPERRFVKPYTIVCFDVMSQKLEYTDYALDNKTKWCPTMIYYTNKLGVMRLDDNGFFSGTTTSLELWVLNDVEQHKWLRKIYVLPPLWKNLVADTRLKFVGMTSNAEIVFSPLGLSDRFCWN